jgi:uncharacterized membrane protein YhaH (DUF805 family)
MSMSFSQHYLSLAGRLSRGSFNVLLPGVLLVFAILFVLIETLGNATLTWLLYPFAAWALLVLLSRRLHDHGRSLASLLWLLVPIAGPLCLLILLCCRAGAAGENQFGADARLRGADYLRVDIHS